MNHSVPKKKPTLILASQSKWRFQMLQNAGISIEAIPAHIDERSVEEPLIQSGLNGADIAQVLAIAKASSVSEQYGDSLVIGADQTLSFEGQLLHKANNMEEARRRLLKLSGKTHDLNSAVALVKNSEILWQYTDSAIIKMRELTPQFIGRHLARVGEQVLGSVGVYQIEGEGVQLFDSIKGDFFTIMGLPLLPLIAQLREMDYLDG